MRRRAFRSLSLLLFSVGLIALTPLQAASLESEHSSGSVSAIPPAPGKQTRSVYIIQFRENPVLGYEGNVDGLAATKPARGQKPNMKSQRVRDYQQYLQSQQNQTLGESGISTEHKVYAYTNAFNGVAANLTVTEVEQLVGHADVVSVWRDQMNKLQTDSTHDFLGLRDRRDGAWRNGYVGEDVVVGVIDSGIYPEHPSFADVNTPEYGDRGQSIAYGPAPASWNGAPCEFGNDAFNANDADFTCNNKLLGARFYSQGFLRGGDPTTVLDTGSFLSARDEDGHGSAAASNAIGNYGVNAEINGESVGDGPMSGVAPRARVAAYKVCWVGPLPGTDDDGCFNSDSMAAIDQAVADGVDVINFSIGGSSTSFGAPDSVAFLFAADAGVWVATSAGNNGSLPSTVGAPGIVPWITSVAAVNDNQNFALGVGVNSPAAVAGDKVAIEGAGSVLLEDVGPITGDLVLAQPADACTPLTNAGSMAGNVALVIRGACAFDIKYAEAEAAGALAIVVYNDGAAADRFNPFTMGGIDPSRGIPGVMIGFDDGDALATAAAVNVTLDANIQVPQVNTVVDFSSRGPNQGALDIIKPDVAAPGVSILSAETPFESLDSGPGGNEFQYISGTSFSSPHVAGAFALLKQAHPDWSPAIARSALMTTARTNLEQQFNGQPATPFDMGAGHIEVNDAFDPGLAYDANLLDYAAFSCANNVQLFSDASCDFLAGAGYSFDGSDLNLPSIGIGELLGSQTVTRTVTNVSDRNGTAVYRVSVEEPAGIDVVVSPRTLRLKSGESASYTVTFTATADAVVDEFAFGSLTWIERGSHGNRGGHGHKAKGDKRDGGLHRSQVRHSVRSPIAVRPVPFAATAEVDATGESGNVDIDVQFGYSGDYNATLLGLEGGFAFPGQVTEAEGLDILCFDLPAFTHFRFATYDVDTTVPGADDLDLRLFYVDNCTDFNIIAQLGGSGGVTSEEVIDVVTPAAGGYVPVIDYFAAASGTAIDYTAWLYLVDGFNPVGTASITSAPASATLGAADTVSVEYSGLPTPSRALGVVLHEDASGEMTRTIIEVDNTQ